MKFSVIVFVLLTFYANALAQKPTESKCSFQELAVEAALGSSEAQYKLGVEFYTGANLPQDFSKAAAMWRLASEVGGLTGAFNNLGYLTYYGKGVRRNYAEGIRLWRVAAENGFPESQIHLATAYTDGKHLNVDYVEAYAWAMAGKHFAEQSKDTEIKDMAEKRLEVARRNLSKSQIAIADKKAAVYITKFAPK